MKQNKQSKHRYVSVYIVEKYVTATSIKEAINNEHKFPVSQVFLDKNSYPEPYQEIDLV